MAKYDLRNHIPLASYTEMMQGWLKVPRQEATNEERDEWRKTMQDIDDRIVDPGLRGLFEGLRDEGILHPIDGVDEYEIGLAYEWNNMLRQENDFTPDFKYLKNAWVSITENFNKVLIDYMASAALRGKDFDGDETKALLIKHYNEAMDRLNAGNFEWFEVPGEYRSHQTGQRLQLEIKDWNLTFGTVNHKVKDSTFVPLPSLEAEKISAVEIELKTGHLLIADWFRIDEFTKAVKGRDFDINSARGTLNQIDYYAKEHGFISVFVGNTCPRIFNNGNDIVVGRLDEDDYEEDGEGNEIVSNDKVNPGDLKEVGYVCTDLWWATMIEKEQLINLVAKSLGNEAATKTVNDYIEERKDKGSSDFTELHVTPGTYTLNFRSSYQDFNNEFSSDDINIGNIEPYFVLSDKALTLKPKESTKDPKTPKP